MFHCCLSKLSVLPPCSSSLSSYPGCRACSVKPLMNIKDRVFGEAAVLGPSGFVDALATGPNTVNSLGGGSTTWFCSLLSAQVSISVAWLIGNVCILWWFDVACDFTFYSINFNTYETLLECSVFEPLLNNPLSQALMVSQSQSVMQEEKYQCWTV